MVKENLRILVVDDEKDYCEVLKMILENNGYVVETCFNGKEALDILEERSFDVVVSDLSMPVMDGFEASRAIRALDRPDAATVPILAMTAQASDECAQSCHQVGMNGRLVKPLDAKKLAKSIREAVQNKQ